MALALFAGFVVYKETVRPTLHDVALAFRQARQHQ